MVKVVKVLFAAGVHPSQKQKHPPQKIRRKMKLSYEV